MLVKMIKNLENRMEKMQESINKDVEELKNNHTETNNTSIEIKTTLIFKSRDITLSTKVHLDKAMGFSSSHVWMWELDCEEGWVVKNWCFWTVVLEKTLENPLNCKEIQPVHSED